MSGTGENRSESGQLLKPLMPAPLRPPTLEQEIRRLIAVHGAEAVRAEIKAATKPRRGRKQERDWIPLRPYLEEDARDWLDGRDPFGLRRNKAIARQVAEANPNKHVLAESIQRRFERKLASGRKRIMLYAALELSEREYPFTAYFRVLNELAKLDETGDTWRRLLALDQEILARHCEVYGEPDPAMTWKELEAKPRWNALAALSSTPQTLRGMFGAAIRPKG